MSSFLPEMPHRFRTMPEMDKRENILEIKLELEQSVRQVLRSSMSAEGRIL